ncbi:laminin subunit beta-2-like isoform X1 [Petromyzon marinus]|uniref:laminin subunit beta-2-like isoform X1 n=1 Tax=Petromyzon marinus TaxID=7757 RepID=UPI003F71EB47
MTPTLTAALLLWAVMSSLARGQQPDLPTSCTEGSCHPATGDLLLGREDRLSATSTCGMTAPQQYCIVSHLMEDDKCFVCDSRQRQGPNSHRVQNVVMNFDPARKSAWWQSENGLERVSLRLDLEAEFHFTHLIFTFKTFRPAAMLVERSSNFGRTWRPYRYFAQDCRSAFPGVREGPVQRPGDVVCDSRYSDIEPSTGGEVIFKVLDPSIPVPDPYSPEIQDLLRVTNLRVNFTALHTLGDERLDFSPDARRKYYYSVYDMVVRGSCSCNGHAESCVPTGRGDAGASTEGMVHGRCLCKHNTVGLNCDECDDFYQDHPWRPAQGRRTHACKRCECNGHAMRCHFDLAAYVASGNVSGGVCDGCRDNTAGRQCETCSPFHYRHARRDARAPDSCVPCDCDPAGSQEGGACDATSDPRTGTVAGQCRCKPGVGGVRCDQCLPGFAGTPSRDNPYGCQPCRCNVMGTVMNMGACDPATGACICKRYVGGRNCERCLAGYWGLSESAGGCQPCDCDFGGSVDETCSAEDGQCQCRPHMLGRRCEEVQPGYYCMPLDLYTSEAEDATFLPVQPLHGGSVGNTSDCDEFMQVPGHNSPGGPGSSANLPVVVVAGSAAPGTLVTWTGPGYARIRDGAGLEFTVSNIPYSGEYRVAIRYKPELNEPWEAQVQVLSQSLPTQSRCANMLPSDEMQIVPLNPTQSVASMPVAVCLETGVRYVVRVVVQRARSTRRHPNAHMLVDSLVLFPHVPSLPGFSGSAGQKRREELERYMCLDAYRDATRPMLAEACRPLVCAISSILHNGPLPCECNPQGVTSSVCEVLGGHCLCRPNVIGRRCDACSPGTFGFGPQGCQRCACDPAGTTGGTCDAASGQCLCLPGVAGRECSRCDSGRFGFPRCAPCQCDGRARDCDPESGQCQECLEHSTGENCDRCEPGYYGDPRLGSGGRCRPCQCPGEPGSGRFFATTCSTDPATRGAVCQCLPGYTGTRCEACAPGFSGDPSVAGRPCSSCDCSGNVDPRDPKACDPVSGRCQRCLHNTHGERCEKCRTGFYGDALRQDCKPCSCIEAGTEPASCPDGAQPCRCDARTGQCRCRAGVEGSSCDRCALGHWGLGGSGGCQPCACNPARARGQTCDPVTGQCECRPGFGGRTCDDCGPNHWGSPDKGCKPCDCHPQGGTCDATSGRCVCRDGVTGARCDACSRGAAGDFPACKPCHACFSWWARKIEALCARATALRDRAEKLADTGISGAYDGRFEELEKKLKEAQDIIAKGNERPSDVARLEMLRDNIRRQLDRLTQLVSVAEATVKSLQSQRDRTDLDLDALERDALRLNASAALAYSRLQGILNSDFSGAFDSIQRSWQDSRNAQKQAETATGGPSGPVRASQKARRRAEDLMRHGGGAPGDPSLAERLANSKKSLDELDREVAALSVKRINEKTCGAPGDLPCSESRCGGGGCRDNAGRPACGGPGCGGSLTLAQDSLARARNAELEVERASAELDKMAAKVAEVKRAASDMRDKAQRSLDRAQQSKAGMEHAVAELRDLIARIKEFLNEEGADPESIMLVANNVLKLGLPVTPGEAEALAQQIRDSVARLSDVDAILAQTAKNMTLAQRLLADAKKAKADAEAVKQKTEEVVQALQEANDAQSAARKAINNAQRDIDSAKDRIDEAGKKAGDAGAILMDAMDRLTKMAADVQALKEKAAANQLAAKDAATQAARARDNADVAADELQEVKDKFKDMQGLMDSRYNGSDKARERAEKLRDQASQLLQDVQDKMKRLNDLEKLLESQADKLVDATGKLDGLEERASKLQMEISKRVQHYFACQN